MTKSFCPGYYDLVTGGVMSADDDTDEINARREVQEEIGIDMGVDQFYQEGKEKHPLLFIKTQKYESKTDNFFCNIYFMKWNGEIKLQESEVDWIEYWTLEQIQENIQN